MATNEDLQQQSNERIQFLQNASPRHPPAPNFAPPTPTHSASNDPTLLQRMASAIVGSTLVTVLVNPLDVVRIRLQTMQSASSTPVRGNTITSFQSLGSDVGITTCCREVFWVQNQSQFCVANSAALDEAAIVSDCAAEETQRRTFNSTLDGMRKIARNEGVTTLWRGLSPTLVMAIPANVIYFAGYDWLRTNPKSPMKGRVGDTYAPLAAGSVARIVAAIAVSPIEMLRTRMQATLNQEKNVMRATMVGLKEMVLADGPQSLWRGLSLTLWRDVPFSALYWWGYERGRLYLDNARQRSASVNGQPHNKELSHTALLTDSFIAGASSGAIAAFVTTPFDVGKTRQQTALHGPQANNGVAITRGPETRIMPRFLWHIYVTEGTSGLFKGWAARCLKVAPACAIMISSYEVGKKMAIKSNERKKAMEGI